MKNKKYDFEIEYLYTLYLPEDVQPESTEEMDLYFFTKEMEKSDLANTLKCAKEFSPRRSYYEFIGTGYMRQVPYVDMITTSEELRSKVESNSKGSYFALIHPSLYDELDEINNITDEYKAIFKVRCMVSIYPDSLNRSKATMKI